MERLTRRNEKGIAVLNIRCPEWCEHATCSPEEGYQCQHQCEGDIIDKLAIYEDAEEQGLLLRLPCKVGDMVYCIEDKQVWCCTIEKISISKNNGTWIEISFPEEMPDLASMEFYPNEMGKTVFLTREEAEAKLKEMRNAHE